MSLGGAAEPGEGSEATAHHAVASLVPGPVELRPLDESPLVSVLITNKDYGRFLPEALDGLLAQTYERWEAIVCDDGSVDDSREVVERYAERDPRISLVVHERSRGQGAAFNTAFDASRGEVIALLDADDVFRPPKLVAAVEALRRSGAGLVVHPLVVVDADGREVQRIPSFTPFERGWIAERVLHRGGRWRWVPTSGVALRRQVAEMAFPMPEEGYVSSADTFFLVLAPLLTTVDHIDAVLALYRRHGANHFARTRFDVERIPRTLDNLALSVTKVNERLDELQRPAPRLRIEDNLEFAELRFQHALCVGARSGTELRAMYRELMRRYERDDLYGRLQRRWAQVMYRIALEMPRGARARWIGASMSATRSKELLRRLWAAGGGGR